MITKLLNDLHDAVLLSINIQQTNFISKDYISETQENTNISLVFQVHSLKEKPVIQINLRNCTKYIINESINDLVFSIQTGAEADKKYIEVNNCVFYYSEAIIN